MKYLTFGLTIETSLDFSAQLQPSQAATEVCIEAGPVPETAVENTPIQRGGFRCKFGRCAGGAILDWENVARFKICGGRHITYQSHGADESTLRLFLLSEVIGVALHQREVFLLHASALRIAGKALVFMGVSGAGKSTTAAAFGRAGQTVLTDDLVAITFIDDRPWVIPGLAQYKVWLSALNGLQIGHSTFQPKHEGADKFLLQQSLATFPTAPVPLSGMNLLVPPDSTLEEGPVNSVKVPLELIRHFPLPAQILDPAGLARHFRESLRIAQHVPLSVMKRRRDFASLETYVAATIARAEEAG